MRDVRDRRQIDNVEQATAYVRMRQCTLSQLG
jgi:hypothetical protein